MGRWTDVPQEIEEGSAEALRLLHGDGFRLNDEFLLGFLVGNTLDIRQFQDADEWRACLDKIWSDYKRIRDGMGLR